MDSKFICLNCGFRDTGNYCSNCSNELKINPLLIHALISNRLKRVGFLSFNDVPNLNVVGVLYLSELAELVERSLKRPQDILLLEQRTGGSLLFEGLILIEGDENNLDIEKLFHLKDILFKNIEERRAKLKMQGVNNISLKILLSYKMPLSNRQMSLIKGNSRTIRFPPCRYTHVSTTAIILAERKLDMNFYTYLLYPYYRQIDFALKQIELSSPINTEPSDALYSFLIDSISLITQPILDYLEGLSMITKTAFLAKLIEEGEIDAFRASTLVKYMVGAVVVSAIISAFFDVGIISLGIPVIDEIINISVFFIGGVINTSLLHFPLRIAGGGGVFRNSFNAITYVSIIFYPVCIFAQGIYPIVFNGNNAPYSLAFVLASSYYFALMSKIHKISYAKVFIVGVLLQLILLSIGLAIGVGLRS